jgi:hypothetical protein
MSGEVIRLSDVRKDYAAARRCEAVADDYDPGTAETLRLFAGELRRRAGTLAAIHGGDRLQPVAGPWGD